MEVKNGQIQYINIQWWMIYDLKLSGNELLLFALIYWYTQDLKNTYHWSLSYIAQWLQISRRSAINLLQKLQKKWLINKTKESHYIVSGEKVALVQKVHFASEKVAPLASEKVAPNNNKEILITNNNINKPKNKIFRTWDFEFDICKTFIEKHIENWDPKFLYLYNKNWIEKLIKDWAPEIEKLKRIDWYSEKQIEFIINYLFQNDFWIKNVFSIKKLRKKDKSWIPYFTVLIWEAKNAIQKPKVVNSIWVL